MSAAEQPIEKPRRVAAVDQFRGYTMAGMFLVNFIGNYAAVHAVFKHHMTHCSYADTIMPGFFFALGFSFQWSFVRRVAEAGYWDAVRHALWRNFKLFLIGFLIYNIGGFGELWTAIARGEALPRLWYMFRLDTFQALVHLAAASVWVLPVIGRSARWRWGYLFFTCALHIVSLKFFYYEFAYSQGAIDGGILGFVGWAIPTLLGTLVCDVIKETPAPRAQWRRMGPWAAGFMIAGYGLACLNLWGVPGVLVEPPFVPPSQPIDMWTMNQKTASPSYMLFGAGWSLAIYLLFVLISDAWRIEAGVFRTLGKNPLFGYLYHPVIAGLIGGWFLSGGSPLWQVLAAFALYFAIVWATLWVMEKKDWIWKL